MTRNPQIALAVVLVGLMALSVAWTGSTYTTEYLEAINQLPLLSDFLAP